MRIKALITSFLLVASGAFAQQVGGPTNWKNGPAPGNQSNSTLNTQVNTSPYINAPAQCLAATTLSQPCVAYTNSFTGLGVSGNTGTINIYSSNAPAGGATLLICPNVVVKTVGTAGSIFVATTWTTPGGAAYGGQWINNITLTSALTLQGVSCTPVVVGANQSLSMQIATTGATGTPVWETEPVVIRLY